MRLRDMARAADDRRDSGILVVAALGAVADLAGAVGAGELLDDRGQRDGRASAPCRASGAAPRSRSRWSGLHRMHRRFDRSPRRMPACVRVAHVASSPGMVRHSMMNSQRSGMMLRIVPPWMVPTWMVVCGGSKPSANGPSLRQPARFRGDIGDRLAGGLDRVHALAGSLEWPGMPRTLTRRFSLPLCARIGCMPDGSPTTHSAGLRPDSVEILDQALRAAAAHFLVVADEQMQRPRQLACLECRAPRRGRRRRSPSCRRRRAHKACHRARRSVNGSALHAWPSTGTVSTWPDSATPPAVCGPMMAWIWPSRPSRRC